MHLETGPPPKLSLAKTLSVRLRSDLLLARVPSVKSADAGEGNDLPRLGWLHRALHRRVFVQSLGKSHWENGVATMAQSGNWMGSR